MEEPKILSPDSERVAGRMEEIDDLKTYIESYKKEVKLLKEDPEYRQLLGSGSTQIGAFAHGIEEIRDPKKSTIDRPDNELHHIYYIDKDQNVAEIIIDGSKIKDYKEFFQNGKFTGERIKFNQIINSDLEKLGFTGTGVFDRLDEQRKVFGSFTPLNGAPFAEAIKKKKQRLENEADGRDRKEFNF